MDTEGYPKDEWLNLCVLHQNRVAHTASAKNCIREEWLARWLDVVIWGHEHECIQEPWVGGWRVVDEGPCQTPLVTRVAGSPYA